MVLFQTIHAGLKAYQAYSYRSYDLIAANIPQGVIVYMIGSGVIWAAAGLILLTGVIVRWRLIPRLIKVFAVVYSLYYWIDYLFLRGADAYRGNWPFLVIVNSILLIYLFWSLSRPKSRQYFRQTT